MSIKCFFWSFSKDDYIVKISDDEDIFSSFHVSIDEL